MHRQKLSWCLQKLRIWTFNQAILSNAAKLLNAKRKRRKTRRMLHRWKHSAVEAQRYRKIVLIVHRQRRLSLLRGCWRFWRNFYDERCRLISSEQLEDVKYETRTLLQVICSFRHGKLLRKESIVNAAIKSHSDSVCMLSITLRVSFEM